MNNIFIYIISAPTHHIMQVARWLGSNAPSFIGQGISCKRDVCKLRQPWPLGIEPPIINMRLSWSQSRSELDGEDKGNTNTSNGNLNPTLEPVANTHW